MIARILIVSFSTIFLGLSLFSQKVPNFNVKDIEGKEIKLYENYLNNGKIVVLSLFFVECPPCNAGAANLEALYKKYGSGKDRVEFIQLSVEALDSVEAVREFKDRHGITFPIVGPQGGSLSASQPYRNNVLGVYQGTPQYTIIMPDRSYLFDVIPFRLEERLNEALKASIALPNKINLNFNIQSLINGLPLGSSFFLKSKKDLTYNKNITELTNGIYSFEYPSAKFPTVEEPYITFSTTSAVPEGLINVLDVLAARKFVLKIEDLDELQQLAADVNNDGKVNITDIVEIQKIILKINKTWPNNQVILMHPKEITLQNEGNGRTINLMSTLVYTGNIKN